MGVALVCRSVRWTFGTVACWLPIKGRHRDKSTYPLSMEWSTSPGIFQYIRDQMPIAWRKSARFSPTGPPLEAGHLVLRCISSEINLSAAPRQVPAAKSKRGASSSQWPGTYLARNKRPSPPAGGQLLELKRTRTSRWDGTVVSLATQDSIDSSFQLTRFC